MNSALYEGWVGHRRFATSKHRFRHRLIMWLLDLSELDEVFRGHPMFSTKRLAPIQFRRQDHMGERGLSLCESVRNLVEQDQGFRPLGPIRLLTNLRHFGYVMNPVSFYYCYGEDGETLEAFVAEVHNTPWNEQHCYTFDVRGQGGMSQVSGDALEFSNPKSFHVSPFMDMASTYRWSVVPPAEVLSVGIECQRDSEAIFDAHLELTRKEITTGTLNSALFRYPLMSAKVITAIYWHAFRLWLKGVPYVPHPQNRIHTGSQLKELKVEQDVAQNP